MMKTNSDESLWALLRLLIDEIVEDLSRGGTGCRSRSVQKTKPAWAMLRRIWFAGRHSPRTTVESRDPLTLELVCVHASRCRLLRKQQKFLPPNPCPSKSL
jgi:hypothetical protein